MSSHHWEPGTRGSQTITWDPTKTAEDATRDAHWNCRDEPAQCEYQTTMATAAAATERPNKGPWAHSSAGCPALGPLLTLYCNNCNAGHNFSCSATCNTSGLFHSEAVCWKSLHVLQKPATALWNIDIVGTVMADPTITVDLKTLKSQGSLMIP